MSNFHPTVGRNVQYIDANGEPVAAIVTKVHPYGIVDLATFTDKVSFLGNIPPFVEGYHATTQVYVYKLIWQNR
jgi:hypothetical protein